MKRAAPERSGTVICAISAPGWWRRGRFQPDQVPAEHYFNIGELIGVFASAVTIGAVLILLNSAWGFGSKQLAAPQATLMKMLVEGVMSGNLPWTLILIGACLAAVIQILGLPVLPVAIGLYLPMELSVTIMIGGIVRWISDRRMKKQGREEGSGILFCSGMIAGEGLVGILLAVFAVAGIDKADRPVLLPESRMGGRYRIDRAADCGDDVVLQRRQERGIESINRLPSQAGFLPLPPVKGVFYC